jgi:hypothetical protein
VLVSQLSQDGLIRIGAGLWLLVSSIGTPLRRENHLPSLGAKLTTWTTWSFQVEFDITHPAGDVSGHQ